MNDNEPWPGMGQAAASHAAKTVARHAGWNLVECPPYHGLPLAAFLHDEARALLVGVTDGILAPAVAVMGRSLIETRSDGVIVGRSMEPYRLPEMALGLWRPGDVAWHQPLLPWLSMNGAMWLVRDVAARHSSACKLAVPRIKACVAPWVTEEERQAGLVRATSAFAEPDHQGEWRANTPAGSDPSEESE